MPSGFCLGVLDGYVKRRHSLHRVGLAAGAALVAAVVAWPQPLLSHETVTTTVLFDREIVRILNSHCVMCHVDGGPGARP